MIEINPGSKLTLKNKNIRKNHLFVERLFQDFSREENKRNI
jgi:hypothetical protein